MGNVHAYLDGEEVTIREFGMFLVYYEVAKTGEHGVCWREEIDLMVI